VAVLFSNIRPKHVCGNSELTKLSRATYFAPLVFGVLATLDITPKTSSTKMRLITALASQTMNNLLLIFLVLISAFSVAAGLEELEFGEPDHLVPDRSVYAEPFLMDYALMVSELLPPEKMEVMRVLVFPSFQPEYAISIQKPGKKYRLEVRQPAKSYWGYKSLEFMKSGSTTTLKDGEFRKDQEGISNLEKEYSISPSDMEINRCSKPLSEAMATDILSILERELFRVKHPEKDSGGLDGSKYHYSMRKGLRTLAGQTWSPSNNLPTGKLVGISNSLYEYCFKGTPENKIKRAIKEAQ
jgi:hypothetical protein